MNRLDIVPRGNVTKTTDWKTNKVAFESGNQQFQRKQITPRVTFSFSTEGDNKKRKYLEEFYDKQCGNLYPFEWEHDGTVYVVRFADSSLNLTRINGYGGVGILGFRCDISLEVCKKSEYDS